VIAASTIIGLLLNFVGIDPMKALVYSAVFNGVAAIPLVYLIACINTNATILGKHRGGLLSRVFVWLTFGVMGLCGVALLYATVLGR
jgi:Mn2+/Fe2+ NRAMP family transporter